MSTCDSKHSGNRNDKCDDSATVSVTARTAVSATASATLSAHLLGRRCLGYVPLETTLKDTAQHGTVRLLVVRDERAHFAWQRRQVGTGVGRSPRYSGERDVIGRDLIGSRSGSDSRYSRG